ncbi:glycosyltransferase family 2 protein [Cellulomonas endophytica]|uniref:glycosyltransferase family 2 protein n=1 Tax=Cellulomonas endophytica TaxID=2494735 RepID=UPI0013E99927|nr:glycosyltransferase family 2 protein [Cellulomonas endophytica]
MSQQDGATERADGVGAPTTTGATTGTTGTTTTATTTGGTDVPGVDVDVVVVAYRSLALLRRCLGALRRAGEPGLRLAVHVVDNASGDGTADAVEAEFPEVTVHRQPWNSGFARANNRVLRDVRSPSVLLLNPDAEMGPGVLGPLLRRLAEDPAIGMIGPRLEQADGTLDHAAKRCFPRPEDAVRHLLRLPGAPSRYTAPDVPERGFSYVDAVNGAFMLVRREALQDVGLLDERYWMYGEDLDWCMRFHRAGWEVAYDGTVTALHAKAGTSGRHRSLRLNWHFHRSMLLFFRDYPPRGSAVPQALVPLGIAARFAVVATRDVVARRLLAARAARAAEPSPLPRDGVPGTARGAVDAVPAPRPAPEGIGAGTTAGRS